MGVAEGAEKISRFMGFDKDICQKMYIAGALHDIGKVAIGNEILEKPEKLTDEEFKTMKQHAVLRLPEWKARNNLFGFDNIAFLSSYF